MRSLINVLGDGTPVHLSKMCYNMRVQISVLAVVQDTWDDNQSGPAARTDTSPDYYAVTVVTGYGLNNGLRHSLCDAKPGYVRRPCVDKTVSHPEIRLPTTVACSNLEKQMHFVTNVVTQKYRQVTILFKVIYVDGSLYLHPVVITSMN